MSGLRENVLVKLDHDGICAPGHAQMVGLWERQRKTLTNLCLRGKHGVSLINFIVTLKGVIEELPTFTELEVQSIDTRYLFKLLEALDLGRLNKLMVGFYCWTEVPDLNAWLGGGGGGDDKTSLAAQITQLTLLRVFFGWGKRLDLSQFTSLTHLVLIECFDISSTLAPDFYASSRPTRLTALTHLHIYQGPEYWHDGNKMLCALGDMLVTFQGLKSLVVYTATAELVRTKSRKLMEGIAMHRHTLECLVLHIAPLDPGQILYDETALAGFDDDGFAYACFAEAAKQCGRGGKLVQLGLQFGYERLSNHIEDVIKAIPSLRSLGVFGPKRLTKKLSTKQQRKDDRCDIRYKANGLMKFALQSHSDLRLLVWGTWEDGDEIQAFLRTPLAARSMGDSEFVDSIGLEQVKYELPEAVVFEYPKYSNGTKYLDTWNAVMGKS